MSWYQQFIPTNTDDYISHNFLKFLLMTYFTSHDFIATYRRAATIREGVWVYWCFTSHATIFQSYMWRHRCAGGLKKKLLYLRSGSQRYRNFAGFFNVPGTNLFIRWFRHTAPCVIFYDTLGIRRTYSRLKPPAPSRGYTWRKPKLVKETKAREGNQSSKTNHYWRKSIDE